MNPSEATSVIEPSRIECPRCGHQLGVIAVEAERRGETLGNCSECGLAVEWAVLRRSGDDPRWFAESRTVSWQPRRRIVRAAATLAMCARPFRFWSRVNMTIPTDRRGIAFFLLAIALATHLLLAARNIHTLATAGGGWVPTTTAGGPTWSTTGSRNPLDYLAALVVPLSSVSVTDVAMRIKLFDAQRGNQPSGVVEQSTRIAIAILEEPGLWPPAWSRQATRVSDVPGQQTQLRIGNAAILTQAALARLALAAAVPLVAPFAILLLPISMRRARIQPRHLARCVVYSAALVIPLAALYFLTPDGLGTARDFRIQRLLTAHNMLLCAIPLTLLWNWAFARNYLRLEHPAAVAASNTALATLASLIATFAVFGWL